MLDSTILYLKDGALIGAAERALSEIEEELTKECYQIGVFEELVK